VILLNENSIGNSKEILPPAVLGQYEWSGTLRRKIHQKIPRIFSKKIKHTWNYRGNEYYATIEIFVPYPGEYSPVIRMAVKFMAEKYVFIDFASMEELESFVSKLNEVVMSNDLIDSFEEAKQRSSK
jgi:hypothetical protein